MAESAYEKAFWIQCQAWVPFYKVGLWPISCWLPLRYECHYHTAGLILLIFITVQVFIAGQDFCQVFSFGSLHSTLTLRAILQRRGFQVSTSLIPLRLTIKGCSVINNKIWPSSSGSQPGAMATVCLVCMLLFLKKHRQEPVAGEILILELAATSVLLNGHSAPLPPNACPLHP